jgi:hypothetical protein
MNELGDGATPQPFGQAKEMNKTSWTNKERTKGVRGNSTFKVIDIID